MLSYCLECKNNTGSQDSKVSKTSNGKIMLLSMYAQCAYTVYQRARVKWAIKPIRNQNPFEQDTIFRYNFELYKNNQQINKFLLAGDKLMPEIHLRFPGFTYNVYGPFTKLNKVRVQKFKQTGDLTYICQKKLTKTCFQYNMAYGAYKRYCEEQL